MNTCRFQTYANGPACGQATLGTYCWFHENLLSSAPSAAYQPADAPQTHAAGTSHLWSTTNTTPELAAAQTMSRTKAPWYRGMKWWKVAIAVLVVGFLVWKFWAWLLLLGFLLLIGMFVRMLLRGGMNFNSNRNTNENLNQNTVSPTFNVSPIVNVQVNRDEQ